MTERETLERASWAVDNRSKEVASAGLADEAASHCSDAAALRVLAAEIEGLRRDAERYRWLREVHTHHTFVTRFVGGATVPRYSGNALDELIDRAIAEGKG